MLYLTKDFCNVATSPWRYFWSSFEFCLFSLEIINDSRKSQKVKQLEKINICIYISNITVALTDMGYNENHMIRLCNLCIYAYKIGFEHFKMEPRVGTKLN